MASRALLKRKNNLIIFGYSSSHFLPVYDSLFTNGRVSNPSSSSSPSPPLFRNSSNVFGVPSFHWRNRESVSVFDSPYSSVRSVYKQSTCYAFENTVTTRASPPQPDNKQEEDGKRFVENQMKKETSPEDCDQAVQGLSSAKAKAKQLQESTQKIDILCKFRINILGIRPALRAIASMSREDWRNKLIHWKDEFKETLQHYWLGLKLLWADMRISSRLMLKLGGGDSLSRRERQQLSRTTADIFRLVPVAVFLVVPFMEFLLPVFLKVFPSMLPSTFQDKMKEQEALKRRLKARMEYAKFLQGMVKEMAKEVQNSRNGESKKTAEDLDDFLGKVRTGARVSNDDILGFAKLFNDELTLDNISRPRLVNMCKYMGTSPFGTDAYLRYMLRKRLQRIKYDDKMIQAEGVESLSDAELRQACRERGILGLLPVSDMRQQLRDWLDLSLNHSLPSSLLILSSAFTVSGKLRLEEAVVNTMSSLPDEVVSTVGVTSLPSENDISERKRKMELLEMQEELIKSEEEKVKSEPVSREDLALKEMATPPSVSKAQDIAKEKTKDQICELSCALAVLASTSSVSTEREEFMRLVNKEIDLYNSMVEKDGTEEEIKKAYNDSSGRHVDDKVSSALIERVDTILENLEKEIDAVDAKIGDGWRLLDRDHDGKVTPEEVAAAAAYLRDTLDKEGIQELISSLSKDKEGKILVQDIVKLGARTEEQDDTTEEAVRI